MNFSRAAIPTGEAQDISVKFPLGSSFLPKPRWQRPRTNFSKSGRSRDGKWTQLPVPGYWRFLRKKRRAQRSVGVTLPTSISRRPRSLMT